MARTNRRAAGEAPRVKTNDRAKRVDAKPPTAAQRAATKAAVATVRSNVSPARRQENRERFTRVMFGGGGSTESRGPAQGRLSMLRKAFHFVCQALNRDHYEFTQDQGALIVGAAEIELEKLRQLVQANGKPNVSSLDR